MSLLSHSASLTALIPPALMLLAVPLARLAALPTARAWRLFNLLSVMALALALLVLVLPVLLPVAGRLQVSPWLLATDLGAVLAVLVQLLGTVIGAFSARYLQGEPRQRGYIAACAAVLAAVHVLLLADHWVLLLAAWALVGVALRPLLCFYPERPFALLAAHKKRIADRLADALLVVATLLAWREVGSGSLSALFSHVQANGLSAGLQISALLLAGAVILRTALLPVHGWLIQVMEAPTPVSALLHAGVVNLGGFVLIRFAPLFEHAAPARWLLVVLGLATAVLAGMVMLTRISIKVRLAWSTVAQMGFMLLECGLGLYTLAALHLIAHSLYKAHAFLAASGAVRQARLQDMRGRFIPVGYSLWLAPVLSVPAVLLLQQQLNPTAWPWWWSALLGLAWAPLMWLPAGRLQGLRAATQHALTGLALIAALTGAALLAHALPWQLRDAPADGPGLLALGGMALLYLCLVALHLRPQWLDTWRRWSYAGFYVDERYTRLALRLWPGRWTPQHRASATGTLRPAR